MILQKQVTEHVSHYGVCSSCVSTVPNFQPTGPPTEFIHTVQPFNDSTKAGDRKRVALRRLLELCFNRAELPADQPSHRIPIYGPTL